MSAPRVRTTKPVTAAEPAVGETVAVTCSCPGTVAVVGASIVTPRGAPWRIVATVQTPAPPVASVRATVRAPPLTGNEMPVGEAKSSGFSARGRLIRPPPSRSTETSRPPTSWTGSAVWTSADLICATVQLGRCCLSRATPPATCGLAMLVPSSGPHGPPCLFGSDDVIATPGALTSGFS